MAYTALTVTHAGGKGSATDGIMSSSHIPAYPHTTPATPRTGVTFSEAIYWEREQHVDKLNP